MPFLKILVFWLVFLNAITYINCFKNIESHYVGLYITKDEAYRDIVDRINVESDTKTQEVNFMKAALNILSEEDKRRLCADYYEAHCLTAVHNKSIFINIIKTENIELIDKYIGYIDNISAYLSYAVETRNIEVVKHFLEMGADINYYPKEAIHGLLTPLKTAIKNNDYKMVQFLIDNRADIHLSVEEDIVANLQNTSLTIFDRYNHVRYKECKETDEDVKNYNI